MLSSAPPVLSTGEYTPPLVHQTLDDLVSSWLKRQNLQRSLVGLEIVSLPSGRVLFSHDGTRRFTPASTLKLLTTACAFDTLGAAFTYKTRLHATGEISWGTVHGDLVIDSAQDPTFSSDDLRRLLSVLKDKKINRVEGNVYIAPVPGGFEQFFSGWLLEDWGQEWMPVCSNLVVNRNIASAAVAFKGIKVVSEPLQSGCGALARSVLNNNQGAAWLSYNPAQHVIRVFLSPGISEKAPVVVANPDEYDVLLACSILRDMGIQIGHRSFRNESQKSTALGEHISRTLPAIVQTTLHESDNLYAQQILRTLGLPSEGPVISKLQGSITLEEQGLNRVMHWLNSLGVSPAEAVLFDGCGLSRKNYVTPHALNVVLKHMASPAMNGPYLKLLKTSGNGSEQGGFHFKTGAMDSVRAVTGVLTTCGGQTLAVSVMVNGHTPSIQGLKASISELIALLNTIIAMSTPPAPDEPGIIKPTPGKPGETVVEVTLSHRSCRPLRTGTRSRRHKRFSTSRS